MDEQNNRMKRLAGRESYGQQGSFKGEIFIESAEFDSLPKEIKNEISFKAGDFLASIREAVFLEWSKINEADKRDANIEKLKSLFTKAGFTLEHVEVMQNQYHGSSCCYASPWIKVTTQKGPILLGWRKRVINIDWSESDIKTHGSTLFGKEEVTVGKRNVHAWGYDKAVEYLKKLNSVGAK